MSSPQLSQTIDDYILWMSGWTGAVACKLEPLEAPKSFTSWRQAAVLDDKPLLESLDEMHDQLHRVASLVVLKMLDASTVPSLTDFNSVTLKYQEFIFALRRLERALAAADAGLDALTGLKSRTGMGDELTRELSRFQRGGKPVCLGLVDIDHFKQINDTYGHASGDKVLASVAHHLTRSVRPFDDVWRWGGEEFLVCLKDADTGIGQIVLERIRGGLEKLPIKLDDTQNINVTASFGLIVSAKDKNLDETLSHLDKALYSAKAGGRNRVVVATDVSTE